MCGIAGEIGFDGRLPDLTATGAMAEAMICRGPDGSGMFAQNGVALAHRRLKIIDLSEASQQPMIDNTLGLGIVFNGAIYNRSEEHTSELQSLMRISYAVFCLKKKIPTPQNRESY